MTVVVGNVAEWHGLPIVSSDGQKIGPLDEVYVETSTDEPHFATVTSGLVRKKRTFVPIVDAVAYRDRLEVTAPADLIGKCPDVGTDELTVEDESLLYGHYDLVYEPAPTPSGRRLARR